MDQAEMLYNTIETEFPEIDDGTWNMVYFNCDILSNEI